MYVFEARDWKDIPFVVSYFGGSRRSKATPSAPLSSNKQPLSQHLLQDLTFSAFLVSLATLTSFGHHRGAGGVLEDFSDAFVGSGRTFEVFMGADLLADVFGL